MQIEREICLLCGIILIALLICGPSSAANLTAEDYYNQGIDFASLRQYTDAVASYDNAIRINPDYSNAWYNRGIALLNLAPGMMKQSHPLTMQPGSTRIIQMPG